MKVTVIDPRKTSLEALLSTKMLPLAPYPPVAPKEVEPAPPAMDSFKLGTRFWVGICLAAAGGVTLLYLNRR